MNVPRRIAVISLGALSAFAVAGPVSYGQVWYINYTQTSNTAPTTPDANFCYAQISTSAANDITAARWFSPIRPAEAFIYVPPQFLIAPGENFATEAQLRAAFPVGNYFYGADAGDLAGQGGTFNVTFLDFPIETPRFSGSTYSNLQLTTAGVNRAISFNAFTTTGVVPDRGTGVIMSSYTIPGEQWSTSGPQTLTGASIPGSELKSGHRYLLQLSHSASRTISSSGFMGQGTGSYSFYRRVEMFFNVKANAGTVAGQLELKHFNRPVGEVVNWEVINTAGAVLDSGTTSIGYDNWYVLNTTALGNYRIRFQGRHWLSTVTGPVRTDLGVNFLNVSLRNGDVNGDNIVDIADYGRLALAFDSTPGAGNWDEPTDLDGNSIVDIADYGVLAAEFDGVGQ